jgi:hypothetical protein
MTRCKFFYSGERGNEETLLQMNSRYGGVDTDGKDSRYNRIPKKNGE